jgi:hypothetical protein
MHAGFASETHAFTRTCAFFGILSHEHCVTGTHTRIVEHTAL